MNTTINKAQDWLDTTKYPFEHHYIQLDAGKMHYVDEGEGDVMLFVHGTPTWSFLFRDLIQEFSNTHRTIALDHIGFGLSDKPADFSGKPEDHAANLTAFIQELDLKNITLVVHDFGGPIGLAAAIESSDRISQVIAFNTWLWETSSNPEAQKIDKLIHSFIGRFLYLRLNFSPRFLLRRGFHDKSNLPREIHQHYIKPFPDKESRMGLYKIAQSLVGSSAWYQKQWDKLAVLENKPWLIIWGMKDEFISEAYLNKWVERLPDADVHKLETGHFVPEEKPEAVISIMKERLDGQK